MPINPSDENLVKVTFEIELNPSKKNDNYSLKQTVDFLDQLGHLHEGALKIAYGKVGNKSVSNRIHADRNLVVNSIKLDNSFKFSVSFFIDLDCLFPYYFAIKAMIGVCEKYGENTDELLKTLKRVLICIQKYIEKSPSIRRRIGPKIEALIIDFQDNIYLKDLEALLNDPKFQRVYNSFCKTSITIKNIVSLFEFLEQKESDVLIENYND